MMGDDDLRRQLIHAADKFPVGGWHADVQHRVIRRRRITTGLALAVGIVAAIGAATAVPLATGWSSRPDRTTPPAFTTSAGYVGSSWRLTSVSEAENVTAVPAGVGARMDLLPDGRILVHNGVNTLSGRFTKSAEGFEVRDVGTTFVLYNGSDPQRLAAAAALNTVVYGNRDGVTPSSPARNKVVSADRSRLVIQAGSLRLTFEWAGPASATRPDLPTASGKSS